MKIYTYIFCLTFIERVFYSLDLKMKLPIFRDTVIYIILILFHHVYAYLFKKFRIGTVD